MIFRQFGILLMIGGFLTGRLLASLLARADFQAMSTSAGAAGAADLAKILERSATCTLIGNAVALFGLVIYFYGVLTSRSGRTTVVTGHPV